MKAAVYHNYGPPEVLQLQDVPKPTPGDYEVVVRVRATTVTSGDWRVRAAAPFGIRFYNGLIRPKRTILGSEFAGRVEAVGRLVQRFREGDPVFGYTPELGAHAEYICLPEDGVISTIPMGMSYEEAAAIPNGALTALYFLKKADIQPGQHVLINGASGSVGAYAVQLAKAFGAHVTGVCSTRHIALVKRLGADDVIDYTKEKFTDSPMAYDVIFDTVGKTSFHRCRRALYPGGIYLSTSIGLGMLFQMLGQGVTNLLPGRNTRRKAYAGITKNTMKGLDQLRSLLKAGKLYPVIDRLYDFEDLAEAHRYVQKGHKAGNVAVVLDSVRAFRFGRSMG